MHAEEIGKCGKLLIGESFGQAVDKTDERSSRRALVGIDLAALGALAVGVVAVVLAHTDHLHAGMGAEDGIYLLHSEPEDIRIGQAPLAMLAGAALPIDIRIILGMRLAIDSRRQDAVEGMYP